MGGKTLAPWRRAGDRGKRASHGLSHRTRRSAFSLLDILVSVTVIAVLIALLLPTLYAMRETTRKVVCLSNVRQLGLGLAMYADDYEGSLPLSDFAPRRRGAGNFPEPENMMVLRRSGDDNFDGLGWLFSVEYLPEPSVYYCPSHRGEHPYNRYSTFWRVESVEIVGNYHFRGAGPDGFTFHFPTIQRQTPYAALVTDGLRTQADFNHEDGANVLRADLSVAWYSDQSGTLFAALPTSINERNASQKVGDAWRLLDGRGR